MQKYRIKKYYCDKCGKFTIYVQKDSVVGMGIVLAIIGLCTSSILIGIPILIVGIVKIMKKYRYYCKCSTCGFTHYGDRFAVEDMLRKQGEDI